ncbi:flagellar biosynthesis protein FliR [Croceibacterium mercuriale]|uniref:Flagellar biosynthetic protein FliR n=1 Tax=Croceibacterium mercuriale TaxID=1572751 RepID=A0A0B2C2S4_9SPHN|nr:flagellar biosynthetic protein FliR [Croceibacterium mercuriale]KHL26266.1 flagellar biosynthesis protein FliR [Croceibacterium mercuriale]
MIGLDFGFGALEAEFWRMVFLMTRIGAALLAAPLFGGASVPATVRTCLIGALAIFAAVWLPDVPVPPSLLSLEGLLAVAGEVLVGATLGFVLQLAFAAPPLAAEIIAGSMGMSMAVAADPQGGGQTTAFGQYFNIVLVLIFLGVGAHLHWIALLMESYRAFPPGETWLGPERLSLVVGFGGEIFATALRIGLPVTLILLLVQFMTGVLSRAAPSLNLFALGLPAAVLAGIAALIITAPLLHEQLEELSAEAIGQVGQVLR